ncbi:glycosyltransferase [Helicobacter jaachi]|uniref:Glycosyltransferase n=1 Tax=Helicobacter jaachi TaxID=1677920 RepID=A0A4U8TAK7_9HELI|nr:glycosyltransferase [Helicobacter jaachi]TLD96891.1 glycosyltransferase [Helicobacter jaachi]
MSNIPISVTLLVKNAQDTLAQCLQSLQAFDEIILLDNQSSDDTLKIAQDFNQTFKNLRIYQSEFIGFGALKNLAISYAKHDIILSIDADEILESSALEWIQSHLDSMQPNHIYALPRKNLYRGEWIKACGWYPDYVWRIFNKQFTRFNDNIVHESVIIPPNAKTIKLPYGLTHYAYENIAQLLDKLQRYTTLYATQHTHKSASPLKATIRGLWSFVRNYFFKKGFCYGYKGFVISLCNALGSFFKYMKLYEANKPSPSDCTLIVTTYNQKERLALVLDSIKALNPLPKEVLIADDGSAQDTRELIESYMPHFPCALKHIWQEDRGFRLSAIRNLAIKAAQGKYIIIIDGDMILESHFIKDHLRAAQRGVFIQASRVILDAKTTQHIMDSHNFRKAFAKKDFKATRCALLSALIFKTSKINARFFAKKDFIKGIRGCNMSFFKADCVDINGFNEAFVGWGREDSEFVARFLFHGGQLKRLKFAAIAYHLYHKENTRDMLASNHAIYLDTIKHKSHFCAQGLKHTTSQGE